MRLVAGLVRGKAVDQAKAILLNSTKAASRNALQTLKSAVANYAQLNPDERVGDQELFVKSVFVDAGATLKECCLHRWVVPIGSANARTT